MTTITVWRYQEGIRMPLHQVLVTERDNLIRRLPVYKWYQHSHTHQIYSTFNGGRVYLQDVIKGEKGPWVHANGDPLDFRSDNLVKTTTNIRTVKRKPATSRSVGVCFVESRNRWKATLSGKLIGYFKTEEEAAQARVKKVLTLNPMMKFIPEGTDPDGPAGMKNRQQYKVEGGRPDAYLDLDDVEDTPIPKYPSETFRDWKAIPPKD